MSSLGQIARISASRNELRATRRLVETKRDQQEGEFLSSGRGQQKWKLQIRYAMKRESSTEIAR
jgi:hypothetical protein